MSMRTKNKRFPTETHHFAYLDEKSKREIRRQSLKAIAIPGYQVSFVSRELPVAKGWGTGGLQLTLSLIGASDRLKVIDQGSDESVNAVSIRRLAKETTGVETTADTAAATIIQTRHRIPEEPLRSDQILVLQVPQPDPIYRVEPREDVQRRLHGMKEYVGVWLSLYENIIQYDHTAVHNDYPVMVHERYLMAPSPIPRWDTHKLHMADHLSLFGAGRAKKMYAVPPYTKVVPIEFADYPIKVESMKGRHCRLCGSTTSFLEESMDERTQQKVFQCSDTSYCHKRRSETREVNDL